MERRWAVVDVTKETTTILKSLFEDGAIARAYRLFNTENVQKHIREGNQVLFIAGEIMIDESYDNIITGKTGEIEFEIVKISINYYKGEESCRKIEN